MADAPETAAEPRFTLRGQYIKDLSLENPHAPESFLSNRAQPKVDMNLDLAANLVEGELYEIALRFNVRATGERTLFLIDLTYAGIFEIQNVPAERIEGALMVDGAMLLYPFARRVIADTTRDAGFPPLLLEPVDFFRLYSERLQQQQAQASQDAPEQTQTA